MSQQEINPIEDWSSEELSEAELDALAGGQIGDISLFLSFCASPKIQANIDTGYNANLGAVNNIPLGGIVFNITRAFP